MKSLLVLLSYPRGVVLSIVVGLFTLLMSVVALVLAVFFRSREFLDFLITYVWSRPLLYISNVYVEVKGTEHVQGDAKGFLILFNHSSLMDIPILCAYFPRSFRFGAKIELYKIPFFGRAMKLYGVLPIDRRNRNKVMQVYTEAIARVQKGEVFALAPEGTRQTGGELGRFKRGPFEFAINAQMDIVPVVIVGADQVLPADGFLINAGKWRQTVRLQILPRVPTAGLVLDQAEDLQERVHAMMAPIHRELSMRGAHISDSPKARL